MRSLSNPGMPKGMKQSSPTAGWEDGFSGIAVIGASEPTAGASKSAHLQHSRKAHLLMVTGFSEVKSARHIGCSAVILSACRPAQLFRDSVKVSA